MTNKPHSKPNRPSEPQRHQISTKRPDLLALTHLCNSLSGCRSQVYLFVCLFLAGNKAQMRDGACNSLQRRSQRNSSKWWIHPAVAVYLVLYVLHTSCNKHVSCPTCVFVIVGEWRRVRLLWGRKKKKGKKRKNGIIFFPSRRQVSHSFCACKQLGG